MFDAHSLIKEWIINNLKGNANSNLIGAELEFPIVQNNHEPVSKLVIVKLFDYLVKNHGFAVQSVDLQHQPIHLTNQKNKTDISLEYCHGNLEFSIGPYLTINEIVDQFNYYLNIINPFLIAQNHSLLFLGLNPYSKSKHVPILNTPFHDIIKSVIIKYSQSQEFGFVNAPGMMSSVQTHVGVPAEQFIENINMHICLNGIRAILFANSAIWNDGINYERYRCIRDLIWKGIGLQSEGYDVDAVFSDEDHYYQHLANQNIYYVKRNNDYIYFDPISLHNYFQSESISAFQYHPSKLMGYPVTLKPEKSDIQYFKSFDLVRITRFGSLEIRGDCQQPKDETFAPVAFNLGIQIASHQIVQLIKKHSLPSNLRKISIQHGFATCDLYEELSTFIGELLDIINQALCQRGYGEEKYLYCLYERLRERQNPAEKSMRLLGNNNLYDSDIFKWRNVI